MKDILSDIKKSRFVFFRSFTILELLLVITIIVILASLLLPAMRKAKQKSHEIACASNLKQIGTGHAMYAEDSEGWFPYTNGTTVADQNHFSDARVWSYLKSGTDWKHCPVYVCPSGNSPVDTWAKVGFSIASGWDYGHKYGYGFLFNYRTYSYARIKNGSKKAYLLDAATPSTSYGEILANSAWLPAYRHFVGANVLFFDFHVRREKATDIMSNKDGLLYPPD